MERALDLRESPFDQSRQMGFLSGSRARDLSDPTFGYKSTSSTPLSQNDEIRKVFDRSILLSRSEAQMEDKMLCTEFMKDDLGSPV